jgi:hypothetical protein
LPMESGDRGFREPGCLKILLFRQNWPEAFSRVGGKEDCEHNPNRIKLRRRLLNLVSEDLMVSEDLKNFVLPDVGFLKASVFNALAAFLNSLKEGRGEHLNFGSGLEEILESTDAQSRILGEGGILGRQEIDLIRNIQTHII